MAAKTAVVSAECKKIIQAIVSQTTVALRDFENAKKDPLFAMLASFKGDSDAAKDQKKVTDETLPLFTSLVTKALTVLESVVSKQTTCEALVEKSDLMDDLVVIYDQFASQLKVWSDKYMMTGVLAAIRPFFVYLFSWPVIPSSTYAAVSRFLVDVKITTIIDPLCGTGFSTLMFRRHGMKVRASDADPFKADGRCPYSVRRSWISDWAKVDATKVDLKDSKNTALLLSWIPPNDVGLDCIKRYTGEIIILVGETGGCCGTVETLEHLYKHWDALHLDVDHLPTFIGITDTLTIFRRKKQQK